MEKYIPSDAVSAFRRHRFRVPQVIVWTIGTAASNLCTTFNNSNISFTVITGHILRIENFHLTPSCTSLNNEATLSLCDWEMRLSIESRINGSMALSMVEKFMRTEDPTKVPRKVKPWRPAFLKSWKIFII